MAESTFRYNSENGVIGFLGDLLPIPTYAPQIAADRHMYIVPIQMGIAHLIKDIYRYAVNALLGKNSFYLDRRRIDHFLIGRLDIRQIICRARLFRPF